MDPRCSEWLYANLTETRPFPFIYVAATFHASVTYQRYKWINYLGEYNRPVNFIRPGRFSYVTTTSQCDRT